MRRPRIACNRHHCTALRAAALLALVVLVAACAEARPDVDAWTGEWDDVRVDMPADAAAAEDITSQECRAILGMLRERGPDLLPAPDEIADETVRDWLEEAEATFFDCPPSDGFGAAYQRLLRLEAEIEVVLAIDRGS